MQSRFAVSTPSDLFRTRTRESGHRWDSRARARARARNWVGLVVGLLAAPSHADTLRASPFRGVLVPAGAVAGDADATSVETNPGQLGLLEGASLALVIDQWGDRTPRVGRGEA